MFTFHDVDLIPENDKLLYKCDHLSRPRHLSAGVNKFNYKLPYAKIFGGVVQIPGDKFEKINGYSNMFWGWGGEDDDLYSRLFQYGKFKMVRADLSIGRTVLENPKKPSSSLFWVFFLKNDHG